MNDNGLSLRTPLFRANLEALAIRQRSLSEWLSEVRDFGTARIVTGRDGADVAWIESTADADRWLGGSSMPTVSGPVVISGYVERRCSVLLPTMGTGYEPRILVERIDRHCTVFAYESDPALLALALHVVDLADFLRNGRVVLLCGDLEASLVEFFSANDGYEFPSKLHSLPQVTRPQLEQHTAAVQRAAVRIHAAQQSVIEDLAERMRSLEIGGGPHDRPRVAVLSIDPGAETAAFAANLQRSMQALDWPSTLCVPDRPERCSAIARLRTICEHQPDLLLFINCTPGAIQALLPVKLVRACWFLESATLPAAALSGLESAGRLIAASVNTRDQLVRRGANAVDITVLEPGVDDRLFSASAGAAKVTRAATDTADRDADPVIVLADGFDLSPEAAQIGLESHIALWRSLVVLLVAEAASYDPSQFSTWLRRAEKRCGVSITDPPVREQFRAVAEYRLSATMAARGAVEALMSADMHVALFGKGWDSHEPLAAVYRGAIPDAEGRRALYAGARAVVLPSFGPESARFACETLACGVRPILCRQPAASFDNYPQTGPILSRLPSFGDGAQLLTLFGDTTRASAVDVSTPVKLRHRVMTEHAVSRRLRTVRRLLAATARIGGSG